MRTAREYHCLALDCLDLAEVTRDPEIREQMIRLAKQCARKGDRAESRVGNERRAV
jgi:hypothetical protein